MIAIDITTTTPVELLVHRRALALPLAALAPSAVGDSVAAIVRELCPLASATEKAGLAARVVSRLRGLGPLEELLELDGVTEVMINGPGPVWLERDGELTCTAIDLELADIEHLIERIVAPLGRRLDRTSPLVDGRLGDGSRVHVAAAPVGVDGPYVTIRRFQITEIDLGEITTPGVAALLRWAVRARCNVVVCGGTSSGKTTVLNSLAREIDTNERLVTVEDAAELRLPSRHVVRLEARPASVDGPAPISVRELVRNALRMRPDRIIVGEVRGGEALDMLQAMNTGHEGSLSTVHANSPVDALSRLETMVLMDAAALPAAMVRQQVQRAVDLVVQLERQPAGVRQIVQVGEPTMGPELGVRLLATGAGLMRLPERELRRTGPLPSDDWIEQ